MVTSVSPRTVITTRKVSRQLPYHNSTMYLTHIRWSPVPFVTVPAATTAPQSSSRDPLDNHVRRFLRVSHPTNILFQTTPLTQYKLTNIPPLFFCSTEATTNPTTNPPPAPATHPKPRTNPKENTHHPRSDTSSPPKDTTSPRRTGPRTGRRRPRQPASSPPRPPPAAAARRRRRRPRAAA